MTAYVSKQISRILPRDGMESPIEGLSLCSEWSLPSKVCLYVVNGVPIEGLSLCSEWSLPSKVCLYVVNGVPIEGLSLCSECLIN